ncbi:hypothetical protein BG000_000131 [Podila horticola]|nr:hypothetical protein BG000_000131 [Podila horticola]
MVNKLTSLCMWGRTPLAPMAMVTLAQQQCGHLAELQVNVLAPEFTRDKAVHSSQTNLIIPGTYGRNASEDNVLLDRFTD